LFLLHFIKIGIFYVLALKLTYLNSMEFVVIFYEVYFVLARVVYLGGGPMLSV